MTTSRQWTAQPLDLRRKRVVLPNHPRTLQRRMESVYVFDSQGAHMYDYEGPVRVMWPKIERVVKDGFTEYWRGTWTMLKQVTKEEFVA